MKSCLTAVSWRNWSMPRNNKCPAMTGCELGWKSITEGASETSSLSLNFGELLNKSQAFVKMCCIWVRAS